MNLRIVSSSIAAIIAAASAGSAFAGNTYLLLHDTDRGSLAGAVSQAGGTLETYYPFGVSVAQSDDPDFAANFSDEIEAVLDSGFDADFTGLEVALEAGDPPNSGDDDFFFDLQWGHNYVGAQAAWDAGLTGAGVRVAVLDGGFDLDHPDLAPNINLALSADFTGEGLQYGPPDPFSHGSHVAGTIAAADNGFGTIGVAPDAELVLVKVLSDAGSGSFANIISGIVHAADVDADLVNMSLGTIIPRNAGGATVDITMLEIAVSRAVRYAEQNGTTVIVSGGNAGLNLDGDGNAIRFMDTAEGTVPIAAWAPIGWAVDPENAELNPAFYTNYGFSGIDFGAPGGSVEYPGNELCVVAGLVRPCWVFDLVFSTGNGSWYWSGGTSMAAPHAVGVAALIIQENGGDMRPARVKSELRSRADGCGAGRTAFCGHGITHSGY